MIRLIIYVIALFIFINILLITILFSLKSKKIKKDKLKSKINSEFQEIISKNEKISDQKFISKYPIIAFDIYQKILQGYTPSLEVINEINIFFTKTKFIHKQILQLNSKIVFKRCKATTLLSFIPDENKISKIEKQLNKEKSVIVKKYMVQALSRTNKISTIISIINSVTNENSNYIVWISSILQKFNNIEEYSFSSFVESKNKQIIELLITISGDIHNKTLNSFLKTYISDPQNESRSDAIRSLIKAYPGDLDSWEYIDSKDSLIKSQALYLLSYSPNKESLGKLISYIKDEGLKKAALEVINIILKNNPMYFSELVNFLLKENDFEIKYQLSYLLSQKSDYYLSQFLDDSEGIFHKVIKIFIETGFSSKIINFLNSNVDIKLEDEILTTLKPIINNNSKIMEQFQKDLNQSLKDKLSIPLVIEKKKRQNKESTRMKLLITIISISFLVLPLIYFSTNYSDFKNLSIVTNLKNYILNFNAFFAYYSVLLNSSYLIILLFAFLGMNKQSNFWSIKRRDQLFTKNALPSISIIAPAYCEEATVIENIHSLLNLDYPDFEVIIVNDGSTDSTLETVIKHFKLKKKDYIVNEKLQTMSIRGVYSNPTLPNLKVIDKENGGKADSLNVGINFSKNTYFCGIDADSLLEGDSLLKLVSPINDTLVESVAFGGNIFPVNGCKVDHGKLEEIHIPKKFLARIQTIEYIRSYMAGRLGWATMNSLLIISGAFGLFKRDRVIEVGGYLTGQGTFHKDTVGEDMELVVRLIRKLREQKRKFKIHFSYNANCWTEVPTDMNIFYRQRDRWQRGLIDIITYHFKMMFNKTYGFAGIAAFPYFLIFEIIGPFLELQGYIFFVLSIFLGLLNPVILLILLFGSIILGITVSLSALLISQTNTDKFSRLEIIQLLTIAILENFGIRQLISISRNVGYINSLRKLRGWGKMKRKGFKK